MVVNIFLATKRQFKRRYIVITIPWADALKHAIMSASAFYFANGLVLTSFSLTQLLPVVGQPQSNLRKEYDQQQAY